MSYAQKRYMRTKYAQKRYMRKRSYALYDFRILLLFKFARRLSENIEYRMNIGNIIPFYPQRTTSGNWLAATGYPHLPDN